MSHHKTGGKQVVITGICLILMWWYLFFIFTAVSMRFRLHGIPKETYHLLPELAVEGTYV